MKVSDSVSELLVLEELDLRLLLIGYVGSQGTGEAVYIP